MRGDSNQQTFLLSFDSGMLPVALFARRTSLLLFNDYETYILSDSQMHERIVPFQKGNGRIASIFHRGSEVHELCISFDSLQATRWPSRLSPHCRDFVGREGQCVSDTVSYRFVPMLLFLYSPLLNLTRYGEDESSKLDPPS